MSNAAPSDQRPESEGAIVSLILPPPRDSRSVASIATVATAYLFGMLGMQIVVPSGGRSIASASSISMVLVGLCGVFLGYVLSAIIQRWAFSRRESVLKAEEERLGGIDDPRMTLSRIVFQLEREAPRWSFSRHTAWRWPSFLAKLDAADLGQPRTLVDDRHLMAVATIGLPDELLEPETIAKGGGPPGCIAPALALTVLGCLLLGFASGSFVYPALGVVCLVISLPLLPAVRRRLPWVTDQPRLPIAGVGFVQDVKGRSWTVNNAIMLVKATGWIHGIRIELIGEAGLLPFAFGDETDPEFIKLWQRWNHPHPRPELLD